MNKNKINFFHIFLWLLICVVFTFLVKIVDVDVVGPLDAKVGFSSINVFFRDKLPFNEMFYKISKYIGIIFILTILSIFSIIAYEIFILKKLKKKLFLLSIVYILTAVLYIFFEFFVINYRPIFKDPAIQELEASFPSSHTLFSITVFGGLSIYLSRRRGFNKLLLVVPILLMVIVIITRFLSGVHWFTDIIGGILYGTMLLVIYKEMIK